MFENILYQKAAGLLKEDIRRRTLPSALLLSGPPSSGKLSCALECARVLLCKRGGNWNCTCDSCRRNKALTSQNILLLGSSSRTLEIAAAAKTFQAVRDAPGASDKRSAGRLDSAKMLFVRAVRKLTLRFNGALWEGDAKASKAQDLVQSIEESLDLLESARVLPEGENLAKIIEDIRSRAEKLEGDFLYSSVPVNQIRNCSFWVRTTSGLGQKVVIIENADAMIEGAKNALLKILEEGPEDTLFILTTARSGAMLPTILSRLRVYNFANRTEAQQREVLRRVFRYNAGAAGGADFKSVNDFLQSFLKVKPSYVKERAAGFYDAVMRGELPDIKEIVSSCASFKPPVLFQIFIQGIAERVSRGAKGARLAEESFAALSGLRRAESAVDTYNQSPEAALENLAGFLSGLSREYAE